MPLAGEPAARCSRPVAAYLDGGSLARGGRPGRCSCTPTRSATGCGGSPRGPGTTPPDPGTPTPCGRPALGRRRDDTSRANFVGTLQSLAPAIFVHSGAEPGPPTRQSGGCWSSSRPDRVPRPPDSSTPWLEDPAFAGPVRLALHGRRPRPRPLRQQGRRRDHPRHRDRPAAAGRVRPDRRPRALPASRRRVRADRRGRRPQRRRADRGGRRPGRSPPSRRWSWSASAARRWPTPPP